MPRHATGGSGRRSPCVDTATHHQCAAVVVENLDFADARATGRETLGRGVRGKRFRRTVAGIPNRQVPRPADRHGRPARRRGHRCGCGLHQPLGHPTLAPPLQQQTSDPATVTGHHGAAAAIGRRGLGLAITRHPAGPRNGGRTVLGTAPGRPDRQPAHAGRHGSSGPPTRTRCAPVHQRTPARCGQTVRNATEQNRQLLTHEERSAPLRCRRWRQVIDSVAAKAALIAGGRICCRRRRALQHRSPAWCSRLRRRRLNLGWVDYRVGLGLFARCDRGVAGIPRCSSGRNRHWHW